MGLDESLGLLVDGSVVRSAYLVSMEEGVVASWPPGSLDSEVLVLVDSLFVPLDPGLYFVIGGGRLSSRYVGLVAGRNILLLRVGERVSAESFARSLARIYYVLHGYEERIRRMMGAANSSGDASHTAG